MRTLKFIILLVASSVISTAYAQNGKITGKVTDAATNEGLVGLVVRAVEASTGTVTNIDGIYELSNIKVGKYTLEFKYVSYKSKIVPNVMVTEGGITTIDISLEPLSTNINEVEVLSTRVTNTEKSVLAEMRKASQVVSGVSSQQIAKSQDRNASDVVKRIPGVTIFDDRFIMIRGLNDRYNSVWLNDASVPSTEPDKKSFSFDILPSGLIDRIMIYKTATPDLPGDFAGGMVKIYTKAFPSLNELQVGYQQSYRQESTGKAFYYTAPGKTDFLGFDDGSRAIPDVTPAKLRSSDPDNSFYTKSFKNTWSVINKPAPADQRLNFYLAKTYNLKSLKIGNATGLNYSSEYRTYKIHTQDWDSTAQSKDYTDIKSTHLVKLSAIENISMLYKNSKFEFKNFFNQTGNSETILSSSNLKTANNERIYQESYESKTIYSSQLSGEHPLFKEKTLYNWTLGYSYDARNSPDLKRLKYTKKQKAPDSLYKAQIAPSVDLVNGGGRFFQKLKENIYSFNHNVNQKIQIGSYKFELNLGNFVEYKTRTFDQRSFGYTIRPGKDAFTLTYLPVDSIFNRQNVGAFTKFNLQEATDLSDSYTSKNKLIASYIVFNLPLSVKLKAIGGFRYEYNVQSIQSYLNLNVKNEDIKTKSLLPSINLIYNFSDNQLVRLAYSKTLNRPEFRESSSFHFYDFEDRADVFGATFPTNTRPSGAPLLVCQINNLDLRYEYYTLNGEMVQIGLFDKEFKDPIQKIVSNAGGDSKAYTFTNATSGFTRGIEIDVRKNLSSIGALSHLRVINDLSVIANLALIQSQVKFDNVINVVHTNPLQGQSPYVINTGIYYQKDSLGLQATLLYNVFGARVYALGTVDSPNIIEMPKNTLDFTLSKRLGKKLTVSAGIQDILNQSERRIQDTDRNGKYDLSKDKEIRSFKKGSYYTLGLKFTI